MTANIIIDSLPSAISVDGKEFPIHSDFRTAMLFELLVSDKEIKNENKVYHILNLFLEEIPQNVEEAMNQILLFYRCGKPAPKQRKSTKSNKANPSPKVYDFDYDAGYIYAAFLTQYGIDLAEADDIHWWKFTALFKALSQDNEIVKIMEYRATDTSKIKNKDEKNRIARLKAIHALPDVLTTEEKIARAGSVFGGASFDK